MNKRSIFSLVLLIGGYIALQLIADVAAAKIVQIGGIALPAGTFVFALTFTWRDLIHKRLGKNWAQAAIWVAAGCNLFMVAYFLVAIQLPPAPFWGNQTGFAATLGVVWRIALASIVAELVSELLDTEVYHRLIPRFSGKLQFLRVLGSNLVSLPVDSVVFTGLAFGGLLPFPALLSIIGGQVVFKGVITLISLPGIYLVREHPESRLTPDPSFRVVRAFREPN